MPFAAVLVYLAAVFLLLVDTGQALSPIDPFEERSQIVMLPNERISLDDCHLRYYKYGESVQAAPAFGGPTYLKEFAHMAAVGWTQPDGSISWKCGGSLIWDNFVLTAAHCTLDNETAPDVVRLGDINIFSDKDDQFAQQLKIAQIVRHPDYRFFVSYNDVALLKLEKNVTLHETVAPACLWIDKEVRFKTLEATGWGDTGFAQEQTPSLLKVTLKPITNEECSEVYGNTNRLLRDGLKETQICAGDDLMDTCPGDSGGPLQIKLLHNGKVSPFIVGVTTFGTTCGTSTPGVYTKVSAYYQWILKTIQSMESSVRDWSLEPIGCALRYVSLREYEDDVIVSRSEKHVSLDSTKAHMSLAEKNLRHTVTVGWQHRRARRENCSGILIADDTVLTVAECASHFDVTPSHVIVDSNEETFYIGEIYVHPKYSKNSLYNNIAVFKLKDRVQFSNRVIPACIWHSREIPDPQVEVAGIGRTDINEFHFYGEQEFKPMKRALLPRLSVNTPQNCSIAKEIQQRLSRGLAPEHLCVGDRLFLVPESCRLSYGGPIQRKIWRNDRSFTYAYGLNAFGRDCGFGEAAVGTRLVSHLDWLQSILLPNFHDGQSSVQFINPEWKENDRCNFDHGDEMDGICTHYMKCSKIWNDFKAKRRVSFCISVQVVCCPRQFVEKNVELQRTNELDTCRTDYQKFHPKLSILYQARGLPHTITISWKDSRATRCLASLITKRTAITSASCALSLPTKPSSAILANNKSIEIKQTIIHPDYNSNENLNNIALIELANEIRPSAAVYPAGVWINMTHTPFDLLVIEAGNVEQTDKKVVPMYNSDCQRDYTRRIAIDNLCVEDLKLGANKTCYNTGDQLIWTSLDDYAVDDSAVTFYVVGFYSFGEMCREAYPAVFTRISSYIDWIRKNI
ncbi:uncharacterized protein LOC129727891 [Wyeomyia smithii]|uniref:uncharacterized protein LOC129727891 n=1 Tax=Wyeomyia smithii TaxID=174621 RepID=UPI002467B0D9|nr:uncharacterized protein LOC129727891 [Wyeomyia smithii]XP_055542124.1 uncharacterized protein LOC129727891 [Wyeomyia smithii]